MADLVVIVPSRGRPERVTPLIEAFRSTCTAGASLVFAVDESDPRQSEYLDALGANSEAQAYMVVSDSGTMVEALNVAASNAATHAFAVGFMGDDHCPRSVGWDADYLKALREIKTGIVYGNDLLQGANLPTQVAMTADIVRALGWMAPPALTHLYVDNFWRDLGAGADCLKYLPKTIIEHRHPHAGKAEWDDGYRRVNAAEMYQADATAYEEFVDEGGLREAVIAVRALRAQHGST